MRMTRNSDANAPAVFTPECRRCARLAAFLAATHRRYPNYYARPVPSFGDPEARLLIVGLAPGLHGANATGRPFTGDFAGKLLYETLFQFGLASHPLSKSVDDDLRLLDCRITNAVRCVPPENKPTTEEVRNCNRYLAAELNSVLRPRVILALGTVAHAAVLRAAGRKASQHKFAHARVHQLENGITLVDSYHCSRYNTQTGRLSADMFADVFRIIAALMQAPAAHAP